VLPTSIACSHIIPELILCQVHLAEKEKQKLRVWSRIMPCKESFAWAMIPLFEGNHVGGLSDAAHKYYISNPFQSITRYHLHVTPYLAPILTRTFLLQLKRKHNDIT
jgi:hypothetical protein